MDDETGSRLSILECNTRELDDPCVYVVKASWIEGDFDPVMCVRLK